MAGSTSDALVMRVKPIKVKYVYPRKYNKMGPLRNIRPGWWHLATYSQVPGVATFNTFVPVVKSIIVQLLLALAVIFNSIYTNWMCLMPFAMTY